jgi:MarR family transcriptional regulator, organic hydroperoxide resistance regulator
LQERSRKRQQNTVRTFRLEDHVFFHFTQILGRRTRAINAHLRTFDVDYPRWRILAVLAEYSGATMGRLADLTSIDRTTLTRTLSLMEQAGLVSRQEQESDRRSVAVSLTPAGRRLFARILPLALAETDRALTGFSPKEIGVLRNWLKRIADNLKTA